MIIKSQMVFLVYLQLFLYIENPKEYTKKLPELISEFSKFVGYKIDTQKLIVFLLTCDKQSKTEIKKIMPFIMAPKE